MSHTIVLEPHMLQDPCPKQTSSKKPFVLMPMGAQVRQDIDYQVMTNKYMAPVVRFSLCQPILIPTCFSYSLEEIDCLLDMADGVYLSGSSTNVDPALYGQENLTPEKKQDLERDLFDLAIVRRALECGIPLLGVCRGMQEINIALGGTLHQKAYAVEGFDDHRENPDAPPDLMYEDAHTVKLIPDTWLHEALGVDEFMVNSLHGQALDKLGQGIEILATATDGLVEAIYIKNAHQFTLGVQWHPEWKTHESPLSIKLFQAFGQACHAYQKESAASQLTPTS